MKRYYPILTLIGLFLFFVFPDVALADNCGSLSDCFNTQRAAVAATVGLGIFATLLSIGLNFVPVVGQVKGVIEAITGKDLITGEKLETWERAMNLVPFGAIGKVGRIGNILDTGRDLGKGLRHTDEVEELVHAGRAGRAEVPSGGSRGAADVDAGSGPRRSRDADGESTPTPEAGSGGAAKPPKDGGGRGSSSGRDGGDPNQPHDGEGGKPDGGSNKSEKSGGESDKSNEKGTGKVLLLKLRSGYDTHFSQVEDVVWKKGRGILGGHNLHNFEEVFTNNGWKMDDLIISRTPHPTINGVYEIKYQLPAKDMTGKIIEGQYKNIPFPKTVYDPSVIKDEQMLEWGRQAMANATRSANGRILTGTAPNGLMFQGYIENGEITNFFPILEKP
ncbi:pre-toxin TG domain-containing protein [Paenibacillus spongiae]|uniref:Pre-toxin TG domain-containing protein n=1 Tax=Paenibacillus spongiae TaxID=2909671 RepID=A0ABY5S9A4_9BACL|nr:pre-toxin TG domain-containing protein [Paenibacillus spongiae]UVI29380.1 pre-toxin TG domain-containing protein [Paenibacillus spongiae]